MLYGIFGAKLSVSEKEEKKKIWEPWNQLMVLSIWFQVLGLPAVKMLELSYNTLHGLFSSLYESTESKIYIQMITQILQKELDFFL